MSEQLLSGDELVPIHDAFKIIWQHFNAELSDVNDPAPWFEPPALYSHGDKSQNPDIYNHEAKAYELARCAAFSALLTGDLRATFKDKDERREVPGWAWATANYGYVLPTGRLQLEPLLPDEWRRWSGSFVYLRRAVVDEWLKSQPWLHFIALSAEPSMPLPHDIESEPSRVAFRLPSNVPFVSLSEALSWIAFGISLDKDELDRAITTEAFRPVDARAALADAMARFSFCADGGLIATRGKYIERLDADENAALTASIDPVRYNDFAQFDLHYDGLRYGRGVTWVETGGAYERVFAERKDTYRSVTVDRAALLEQFPPEATAPGVPLLVAAGELVMPGDEFDISAPADVAPWWSFLQVVAWITTRSRAYVAYIADLERTSQHELSREVIFGSVVTYVSRNHCRCPARSIESKLRWEYCSCTGDSGRDLLEAIRADRTKPVRLIGKETKTLSFHDLAGLGQRPTCADWIREDLLLQFSSAEIVAAFPQRELPDRQSAIFVTSTGRAEAECRSWLARQFEADPDKRRNKSNFRDAAMVQFGGRLSVRGFNRVWDSLAPGSGRSAPGRKS